MTPEIPDSASPAKAAGSDFFESHDGTASPFPVGSRARARVLLHDMVCDARIRVGGGLRTLRRSTAGAPSKVLIVGIEVPSRKNDIHETVARLRKGSRQLISVSIVPMLDRGKFANIDAAIAAAPEPLDSFDWLAITDDDIRFSTGLLDDMIAIASRADFALAQPSHTFLSHATYHITRRQFGSLARRTRFVEIGPFTLVRADLFQALVPFPPSRWCYGIDLVWSKAVQDANLKMGIVDGTPVRHTRPVAASYDMHAARDEGQRLLNEYRITANRQELFGLNEVILRA